MGTFVENVNAVAGVITSGVLDPNAEGYSNAIACATIYDQFDDRYLGDKAVAPTLDNDGGALLIGALYFDTVVNLMKVYGSSGWVSAGSSVNGTTERHTYTATAGQTSFTANYESGYVDVYLNGSKLQTGVDFTATSGTAIVLTASANIGDIIDIIAYGVFEVANTTPKGNEAYTVSTVADLSSVPSSYTTAIVKDLDRGGTFIWSSTGTANDGTVFAGATGYWTRQYDGAVNVKWFGAKGDGATDDYIAFSNATSSSKFDVFIPDGTYILGTTLNLIDKYDSSFIGESMSSTIIKKLAGTGGTSIIEISGLRNVVSNMKLLGEIEGTSYSCEAGIKIQGFPMPGITSVTKWCKFERIYIEQVKKGIMIGDYTNTTTDPDIETNEFNQLRITNVEYAFIMDGQNIINNPITNSHFRSSRYGHIVNLRGGWINVYNSYMGALYDFANTSAVPDGVSKILLTSDGATIFNCQSENNETSKDIFFKSLANAIHRVCLIQGCRIDHDDEGVAIYLQGTGGAGDSNDNSTLINNQIRGSYVALDNINYVGIGNTIESTAYPTGYLSIGNQVSRSTLILDSKKLGDIELPDNMLTTNVALKNATNIFTTTQSIDRATSGDLLTLKVASANRLQITTSDTTFTKLFFDADSAANIFKKTTGMMGTDASWFMKSQTATPVTRTDGGVLYVEAGALKFKGATGTITIIAPA